MNIYVVRDLTKGISLSIPVDLPLFVCETYVSVIETVCFITFGTFCGSRRLVLRAVRLFRWFRFGSSGFGGFVSWFRFGGFVSMFRVLVHARIYSNSGISQTNAS